MVKYRGVTADPFATADRFAELLRQAGYKVHRQTPRSSARASSSTRRSGSLSTRLAVGSTPS